MVFSGASLAPPRWAKAMGLVDCTYGCVMTKS
jgi:hypothetical protein